MAAIETVLVWEQLLNSKNKEIDFFTQGKKEGQVCFGF